MMKYFEKFNIKSTLALLLVLGFLFLTVTGHVTTEQYLMVMSVVVAYFFSKRTDNKS